MLAWKGGAGVAGVLGAMGLRQAMERGYALEPGLGKRRGKRYKWRERGHVKEMEREVENVRERDEWNLVRERDIGDMEPGRKWVQYGGEGGKKMGKMKGKFKCLNIYKSFSHHTPMWNSGGGLMIWIG